MIKVALSVNKERTLISIYMLKYIIIFLYEGKQMISSNSKVHVAGFKPAT